MKCGRWMQSALIAGSTWALAVTPAAAWTRAGHMVSAAIAYHDLAMRDPKVIEQVVAIMAHHPERGPFEVAIGRATGEDRKRRIFMQIARWPDATDPRIPESERAVALCWIFGRGQ